MTIFAQHGYGKTTKIEAAARRGAISGAILSPRDEAPDRLSSFVAALSSEFGPTFSIAVDPLFIGTTTQWGNDGRLPEYPYYESGLNLSHFLTTRNIRRHAEETLNYQYGLNVTSVISPTLVIESFDDQWSFVALSLANETIEAHLRSGSNLPLWIALNINEAALLNIRALNSMLDTITTWQGLAGFYLCVNAAGSSTPGLQPAALTRLLYLVYVLAVENGFQIVVGYSDLVSFPLHAAGAYATASGWHNTLRGNPARRFGAPRTGGRRPKPKYTSSPLLNSISVVPELAAIKRLGLLDQVLSGGAGDAVFMGSAPVTDDLWSEEAAILQQWDTMTTLIRSFGTITSVENRLQFVKQCISASRQLYQTLANRGVPLSATSGPNFLQTWDSAITSVLAEI